MAIDRRYQATLEKVKLHSSFLAGNSSFLAGKKSTAQTSGGSDDGASAPMNMCDPDQSARLRHPTGFDLSDTSAAAIAPGSRTTSRGAPRLSAACFVQKEKFLAS